MHGLAAAEEWGDGGHGGYGGGLGDEMGFGKGGQEAEEG